MHGFLHGPAKRHPLPVLSDVRAAMWLLPTFAFFFPDYLHLLPCLVGLQPHPSMALSRPRLSLPCFCPTHPASQSCLVLASHPPAEPA